MLRSIYKVNTKSRLSQLLNSSLLIHQDSPHGDDVADGAGEDEEVEDAVHEGTIVERVEEGTRDVADALGNNPCKGGWDGVDERFQGNKARKAHEDEAGGLEIAVFLEFAKTHDGAHDSTNPHESEESPTPVAYLTQGNEGDGAIRTRNVPIDCCVVPFPEYSLSSPSLRQRVIDRGGNIGREHAKEIEPYAELRPTVALAIDPPKETSANNESEQYACAVGR